VNNFGWDLLVIFALWTVGVFFAWLAYWRGAPTWPLCFVIPGYKVPKTGLKVCGGLVGEIANISLIAGVFIILLVLTPDANFLDVLADWWWAFIVLGIVSAAIIWFYTQTQITKAEKATLPRNIRKNAKSLKQFRIGYRYYVGYCTAIALIIWGIAFVTVIQTMMDHQQFSDIRRYVFDILANLRTTGTGDSDRIQLMFEVVFGQQKIAKGYVLDQVNSFLMLLLCIALAYFAIYKTKVRNVYAPDALVTLQRILFVMIGVCILVACWVFFTIHLVFVDQLLEEFRRHATLMNAGPWELTQRYQEVVADLTEQRGIFGFVIALATARGGLVLIMPALQLLMMKDHDKTEPAKTARA
jgi:hypothetical protein